ncbi:hypothetical protein ACP4OV_025910 [Aristida adscensionis]
MGLHELVVFVGAHPHPQPLRRLRLRLRLRLFARRPPSLRRPTRRRRGELVAEARAQRSPGRLFPPPPGPVESIQTPFTWLALVSSPPDSSCHCRAEEGSERVDPSPAYRRVRSIRVSPCAPTPAVAPPRSSKHRRV